MSDHRSIPTGVESPLLGVPAAARYLGVPEQTLRNWLWRRVGPRSVKLGRHRKFRVNDLDAFIEAHS